MSEARRAAAREIAQKHLQAGDPLGWFEELYRQAGEDASIIPWAELTPNPNLTDWLDRQESAASGRALAVGSGFGDDAEELARRGYETTAFDISPTAVARSRERYPGSLVSYVAADLFSAPHAWQGKFNLVVESYTLQVLRPDLRAGAVRCLASFVAPGGTLLVITRGRAAGEAQGNMPWPLTKDEMALFRGHDLTEISFEDFMDHEMPPVRRFRAVYRRQ